MAALSDNIMSYISANVVGRAGKVLRCSRNMGPLYLGVWHWHREGLEEQPLVTLRLFTVAGIICCYHLEQAEGTGTPQGHSSHLARSGFIAGWCVATPEASPREKGVSFLS